MTAGTNTRVLTPFNAKNWRSNALLHCWRVEKTILNLLPQTRRLPLVFHLVRMLFDWKMNRKCSLLLRVKYLQHFHCFHFVSMIILTQADENKRRIIFVIFVQSAHLYSNSSTHNNANISSKLCSSGHFCRTLFFCLAHRQIGDKFTERRWYTTLKPAWNRWLDGKIALVAKICVHGRSTSGDCFSVYDTST